MERQEFTETEITIFVSQELSRKAQERARQEGTTVADVLREHLEEFVAEADEKKANRKAGSRFLKITQINPAMRLTTEEVKAGLESLKRIDRIAEEISTKTAGQSIDAVDLVREGRREF